VSDVGLTHVALPVSDLDASIAFYARYAQMQVVHRRDGVVWLSDRTRPFVIVLMAGHAVKPLEPFAHLGVACASRDDVDRLCAQAHAEGCLDSGPSDYGPPVGYWAFLRDPDGHTLEISYGQDVGLAVQAGRSPARSEAQPSEGQRNDPIRN
jgi:catechol 2,3-dioxygenase-like lactoylglutathione lyase family enzyme